MVEEMSEFFDDEEPSARVESDLYAARIEYRNAKFRRAVALVGRGIGMVLFFYSGHKCTFRSLPGFCSSSSLAGPCLQMSL